MLLPFLSDEEATDLTETGYPGVVVHWRPMDLLDKCRWSDGCLKVGISANSSQGRMIGLQNQIIRIEGIEVEEEPGKSVPFDIKKHLTRLPLGFLLPIWDAIETKSSLSESSAKNSDRPSGSAEASGSATSSVETVPSASEMSTAAS